MFRLSSLKLQRKERTVTKTVQQLLDEGSRKPESASCGHVLDAVDKERNYKIDDNQICQDCYFEKLGNLVEQHPIGRPTPHGGCR